MRMWCRNCIFRNYLCVAVESQQQVLKTSSNLVLHNAFYTYILTRVTQNKSCVLHRHVTSSLPTSWICWGSSLAHGPSPPKRSSAWSASSIANSAPSKCSLNRAPVKLSWSWGPASSMPGQYQCVICLHELLYVCVFTYELYQLYLK